MKKLIISTIVTAVVLFLISWLGYGVIFKDYFMRLRLFMRDEKSIIWWALIVGYIIQALVLAYLYMKTYKGESPFKEGLLYGIAISLLVALPYIFFMWSTYQVTYRSAIADGIFMGIRFLIAGIVIGLIFGKKELPKTQ
ncbi:MAG: hypothetical protein N2490_02270 [Ignavibacteria bacterium]|nr:hypothetical protein [Ignavibacteria bacterium]